MDCPQWWLLWFEMGLTHLSWSSSSCIFCLLADGWVQHSLTHMSDDWLADNWAMCISSKMLTKVYSYDNSDKRIKKWQIGKSQWANSFQISACPTMCLYSIGQSNSQSSSLFKSWGSWCWLFIGERKNCHFNNLPHSGNIFYDHSQYP